MPSHRQKKRRRYESHGGHATSGLSRPAGRPSLFRLLSALQRPRMPDAIPHAIAYCVYCAMASPATSSARRQAGVIATNIAGARKHCCHAGSMIFGLAAVASGQPGRVRLRFAVFSHIHGVYCEISRWRPSIAARMFPRGRLALTGR